MDSAAIEEANKEVTAVIAGTGGKRQPYLKLADEQQATIGRYTAEHSTVNAIHHFKGDFPKDSLKESTIFGWNNACLQELQSCRREGKDRVVKELPKRKTGCPLMMGEDLDRQVQANLRDLDKGGGGVNIELAIASARENKRKKDSRLLAENGGPVALTKDWAYYLLVRMGYVKRKANSKVKVVAENFEEHRINSCMKLRGL